MRPLTYERLENLYTHSCGYTTTRELLAQGLTNRQIAALLQEQYLEKIANGYFWMPRCGRQKPADYKPVEVCFVNHDAVIVADSACFYQGFISVEPPTLSVGTRRNDRRHMVFPFDTTRHYLAESGYNIDKLKIETEFGNYQVYDIGRSVCDCIRFRESIEPHIFDLIIDTYHKEFHDPQTRDRLLAYARKMKFEDTAKAIL